MHAEEQKGKKGNGIQSDVSPAFVQQQEIPLADNVDSPERGTAAIQRVEAPLRGSVHLR